MGRLRSGGRDQASPCTPRAGSQRGLPFEWLGISIPAPVGPYLHAALLGLVLVFPYFIVPVAVVIVLVALTTEGLKRLRKGQ